MVRMAESTLRNCCLDFLNNASVIFFAVALSGGLSFRAAVGLPIRFEAMSIAGLRAALIAVPAACILLRFTGRLNGGTSIGLAISSLAKIGNASVTAFATTLRGASDLNAGLAALLPTDSGVDANAWLRRGLRFCLIFRAGICRGCAVWLPSSAITLCGGRTFCATAFGFEGRSAAMLATCPRAASIGGLVRCLVVRFSLCSTPGIIAGFAACRLLRAGGFWAASAMVS
jgi:hypothetical protein